MIQRWIQYALLLTSRVGADRDDSDDRRVQKSSLVLAAFMFIFVGALWGILYFVFGQPIAGALPFSYALVSLISTVVFHFMELPRFSGHLVACGMWGTSMQSFVPVR